MLTVLVYKNRKPSRRTSESFPGESTQFVARGYARTDVTSSLMAGCALLRLGGVRRPGTCTSQRRAAGVTAAGWWRRIWFPCRWGSRRADSSGSAAWSSAPWTGGVSGPGRPGPAGQTGRTDSQKRRHRCSPRRLPAPLCPEERWGVGLLFTWIIDLHPLNPIL